MGTDELVLAWHQTTTVAWSFGLELLKDKKTTMLRGTANRSFPELCVKTFTAPNKDAYYMEFIASQVLRKKRH